MQAGRVIAIFLSIGGIPWAILLSCYFVGAIIHFVQGGLIFAAIFLPGFIVYCGWIWRALHARLPPWFHFFWLAAVSVNLGYFIFFFTPIGVEGGFGIVCSIWLLLAALLCVFGFYCDLKLCRATPSKPQTNSAGRVSDNELRRLLDERHGQ
jgi:hypothetical protein